MASKDTNETKIPRSEKGEGKPRQRTIHLTDEDWRVARLYAAAHDTTVSEAFKIAIHRLAGVETITAASKPDASAPVTEKALETFLTKPKHQK